jgi:hypothetical protein
MHASEQKARDMIAKRTTYELIADWEESDNRPMTETLPIVRGWLLDELEKRDKPSFDRWMDSNESSPRNFYIGE